MKKPNVKTRRPPKPRVKIIRTPEQLSQLREATLIPEEAAQLIGVAKQSLSIWRTTKRYGLPYHKAGTLVRYKLSDVRTFIASRTEHPFDISGTPE